MSVSIDLIPITDVKILKPGNSGATSETYRERRSMAMTADQYEELTLLLEQLEPVRGKMKGKAVQFYDDQVARKEKYGAAMFLSVKQRDWLVSMYEELVGPMAHLAGVGASEDKARPADREEDDDDREIPF